MGDDVPLPVLASTPHMLYDYFKQRFAQASARPASARCCKAVVQQAALRAGGRGLKLPTPAGDAVHCTQRAASSLLSQVFRPPY